MAYYAEIDETGRIYQVLQSNEKPIPYKSGIDYELIPELFKWKEPYPGSFPKLVGGTVVWENVLTPTEIDEYDNNQIREKRNKLLQETDWTQLPDVPLNTQQLYLAYRQALREITDQPGFPNNVIWPQKPN
jgi:hypothetical protein